MNKLTTMRATLALAASLMAAMVLPGVAAAQSEDIQPSPWFFMLAGGHAFQQTVAVDAGVNVNRALWSPSPGIEVALTGGAAVFQEDGVANNGTWRLGLSGNVDRVLGFVIGYDGKLKAPLVAIQTNPMRLNEAPDLFADSAEFRAMPADLRGVYRQVNRNPAGAL